MTDTITPSNEDLAELEAELDELRRVAFARWFDTDPVIDLDDEF